MAYGDNLIVFAFRLILTPSMELKYIMETQSAQLPQLLDKKLKKCAFIGKEKD